MIKLLNKQELVNEIIKMERGNVYTLNILDDDKESIWCTLITKTRWFDSHIVIIGGADDELLTSKNFGCKNDNIDAVISELVNDLVYEVFNNKYSQFTLTDKSELNIQSNSPSLGRRIFDNFEYI